MILGSATRNLPMFVLFGLMAVSLAGLLLLPALPQDQSYHLFADCRAIAGIPNFWNVVSIFPSSQSVPPACGDFMMIRRPSSYSWGFY
jgi:hypothetical protein